MKRKYLIAGIAMLILSLAGFLALLFIPTQTKQATAMLNYGQTGAFSYFIYLKPSYLYGPDPQPVISALQYPLKGVATIDFTYNFTPFKAGAYSTSVDLNLNNPGIWQKTINLLPESQERDNFTLSFSLDPGLINNEFTTIEEQTGLTTLQRNFSINVIIARDGDIFTQTLPLTLSNNLLEISSDLQQNLPVGQGLFDYTIKRQVTNAGLSGSTTQYPAELVNSLDFTLNYQPAGVSQARISIEAILSNPGIWQKSIILTPLTSIQPNSALPFSLNLNDIQKQFDEIENQTKMASSIHQLTIQATILQGDHTYTQSLPVSIDNQVLEISNDLGLTQAYGSATFDYTLNLKPNTLFGVTVLHRAQSVAAPASGPDFDIGLKPGPLPTVVPETLLNPEQTAFIKLIDKMNVTFVYQFQSSQPVNNLKTDVDIIATIEAPNLWSKSFNLLRTTRSGSFDVNIPVDIAGYTALSQSIGAETGLPQESYNLTLSANLHTTGDTQYGRIDEVFSPVLKGAISNNVLRWNKNLSTSQPGAITASTTVPNFRAYLGLKAGTARQICLAWGLIFLALFGFSVLMYFRSSTVRLSPVEKMAQGLKKKYGVRLVEAANYTLSEDDNIIPLNSMDDLIKVSDELAKPVIYLAFQTERDGYVYFVLDGVTRYQYSLVDRLPERPTLSDPKE